MPRRSSPLQSKVRLAAVIAVAGVAALHSARPAAADTWVPLGPSGGTVATLAVDPTDGNTVCAGTAEAGVYRSANGGRTWQPAGLTGGISLLAVAPGTRSVYAVAGSFTRTLYRSQDGGASWTSLAAGIEAAGGDPAVFSLAFPAAPGTLFAVTALAGSTTPPLPGATSPHEVLKSTDGGDSWQVVFASRPSPVPLGVYADPTDPRYVYLGTTDGVSTSADGGATWTAGDLQGAVTQLGVENGPRHRLLAVVSSLDPRFRFAQIYASSDRGRTWRLRDGLGGEILSFLVGDPTARGAFVALGNRGILHRTVDAGLHWTDEGPLPQTQSSPSGAYALALDPGRPGVAFVAVPGGSLGRAVWKTATYGTAWTLFVRGLSAGDFSAVVPVPARPGTLWAVAPLLGSFQGLFESTDRGASWGAAGFNQGNVEGFAVGGDGRTLFADIAGRGLLKSAGDGAHWTQVAVPVDFLDTIVTTPKDPGAVYLLAESAGQRLLDVSRDGGASWTSRPLAAGVLAVSAADPATLYANGTAADAVGPGNDDLVQRSTDRGATWTTLLHVTGGTVTAIGTDPADPQRIVVAHEQFDADSRVAVELLWTADGGATWQVGDLPLPPTAKAASVRNFLPDPLVPHGFLAGTSAGAYASADGGATWTPLGEGLEGLSTFLSLDPASSAILYAATEGGGVYRLVRSAP
jgi:photosystem II stability/assembly factor-like uncharacterized protein